MAGAFRLVQMNQRQPNETANGGCLRCRRMDLGETANPLGDRYTFVGFGSGFDCIQAGYNHGEIVLCVECLFEVGRFVGMVPAAEMAAVQAEADAKLQDAFRRELHATELNESAKRVFDAFSTAAESAEPVATPAPASAAAKTATRRAR